MEESTLWWLLAALAAWVIIFVLAPLALFGFGAFIAGTIAMFAWASGGGGVIGTMLMLALWIFALPVMAIIALVVGLVALANTD